MHVFRVRDSGFEARRFAAEQLGVTMRMTASCDSGVSLWGCESCSALESCTELCGAGQTGAGIPLLAEPVFKFQLVTDAPTDRLEFGFVLETQAP